MQNHLISTLINGCWLRLIVPLCGKIIYFYWFLFLKKFNNGNMCSVKIITVLFYRLKNPGYIVNAFNVDPLYLKHEQQGAAPDYRVNIILCVK